MSLTALSFELSNYGTHNITCLNNRCSIPYPGHDYYKAMLPKGTYLLEVWGASGGDHNSCVGMIYGGKGGYSSGYLALAKMTSLYIYIGEKGQTLYDTSENMSSGGWNGGGSSLNQNPNYGGSSGGGGATDICLVESSMNYINYVYQRSIESYRSRIIVAGGGGGAFGAIGDCSSSYRRIGCEGGYGGGYTAGGSGYDISLSCNTSYCGIYGFFDDESFGYNYVSGANQTGTGYVGCLSDPNIYMMSAQPGEFGYGGTSSPLQTFNPTPGGGGGGGWYGGICGTEGRFRNGVGGGGGSGYVHIGSNSLSSLVDDFILEHYTCLNGSEYFPSIPYLTNGNGFVRITYITYNLPECTIHYQGCSLYNVLLYKVLWTLLIA